MDSTVIIIFTITNSVKNFWQKPVNFRYSSRWTIRIDFFSMNDPYTTICIRFSIRRWAVLFCARSLLYRFFYGGFSRFFFINTSFSQLLDTVVSSSATVYLFLCIKKSASTIWFYVKIEDKVFSEKYIKKKNDINRNLQGDSGRT